MVIPARQGSKGIPNKNFRRLDGIELIDYSLNHSLELSDIADILVSSDHHGYLISLHKRFLAEVDTTITSSGRLSLAGSSVITHLRSEELSRDDTPIVSVLRNVLEDVSNSQLEKAYKGVVLLQPTSPFRSDSDLVKLREYLETKADDASSLVSFKEISDSHPARMYSLMENGKFAKSGFFPEYESIRRQDLPPIYLRDGCYYYIGTQLINRGLQVGPNLDGFVRAYPWTINLDSESDWVLAESIVSRNNWMKYIRTGEPLE